MVEPQESLIEELLAGPDDPVLEPRRMALLEAILKQPVPFATIQREKKATGHSPTQAARNKLTLIRDFNRALQQRTTPATEVPLGPGTLAAGHADATAPTVPAPKVIRGRPTSSATPTYTSAAALLSVFTNGISDDRLRQAEQVLANNTLTVNEKLTKIDGLIPFPPTASSVKLGRLLGVTKQAIMQTDWWIQNRKGERDNEVGRRRERHRKRAETYESHDDDGERE
jgi:hypothetical protein